MNSLTKRLITSLILGIATGFIAVWLINVTGRPGQFFLIGVCTAIAIVIGLAIPKRRDTHQQSTHSQPVSFFSSASDREDIFISYRRSDTRDATGRIHEALATHFGDHNIYYDVYDIPPGVDFRSDIETTIHQCRVLLVMIGQYWLNEQNKPRLHNSDDYVRFEVETALKNQIPVIPVLVNAAEFPKTADLPETLHGMAIFNAARVRSDPDFRNDLNQLVEIVKTHLVDETELTESSSPSAAH